jgi:hypothetical protein
MNIYTPEDLRYSSEAAGLRTKLRDMPNNCVGFTLWIRTRKVLQVSNAFAQKDNCVMPFAQKLDCEKYSAQKQIA